VLAKVPAVLWATDRDLRFTASLGAGLIPLGLRPGQIVGMSVYEVWGARDDSFPPVAAHLAAIRGEATDLELEWSGRILEVRVEPISQVAGSYVGAVGLGLDVTDLRNAERALLAREEELRQAQKLEAVGRLARQVVGELGDAFSNVLGVTERLGAAGPSPGGIRELAELSRAASRGLDVVRQLREAGAKEIVREVRNTPDLEGGETILLVDDEPQVRGFVRRALEEYGYRVLETGTVDEALALGASHAGNIHLLLTDVVLPGMSGPQLAARLAPLRPEMRILYMTGYADDAIVHRGVLAAGQALLLKPFTSVGLAHEVKKALKN
jgi:CheY-like chemotaxis protein